MLKAIHIHKGTIKRNEIKSDVDGVLFQYPDIVKVEHNFENGPELQSNNNYVK